MEHEERRGGEQEDRGKEGATEADREDAQHGETRGDTQEEDANLQGLDLANAFTQVAWFETVTPRVDKERGQEQQPQEEQSEWDCENEAPVSRPTEAFRRWTVTYGVNVPSRPKSSSMRTTSRSSGVETSINRQVSIAV